MNGSFRTHYDNLKVSRTAPQEVIAAAYRALSKQFHPDLHQNNPSAERIMGIINASYAVLCDPIKRQAHDEWIRKREAGDGDEVEAEIPEPSRTLQGGLSPFRRHIATYWGIYVFAGLLAAGYFAEHVPPAPSGLPRYVSNPSPDAAEAVQPVAPYVRPATAPNGSTWPTSASYVPGYPISRANGLFQLTIDNSFNATDMFVKLVALDSDKTIPVRHVFIPAHQSFTMNKIRAGHYDVRNMDLSVGSLSRSEAFQFEGLPSAARMTLYKTENGKMKTYPLSASEF